MHKKLTGLTIISSDIQKRLVREKTLSVFIIITDTQHSCSIYIILKLIIHLQSPYLLLYQVLAIVLL